jgi:hypothetical protein
MSAFDMTQRKRMTVRNPLLFSRKDQSLLFSLCWIQEFVVAGSVISLIGELCA